MHASGVEASHLLLSLCIALNSSTSLFPNPIPVYSLTLKSSKAKVMLMKIILEGHEMTCINLNLSLANQILISGDVRKGHMISFLPRTTCNF